VLAPESDIRLKRFKVFTFPHFLAPHHGS